jgi:broad specificity phosphatase PhoE
MIHTVETLKELHEQRFAAMDKAIVLVASEMARRLEVLNHAHKQAREKERDFIGREAFETFVQRVNDDFAMLRRESQTAANVATAASESARKAAADEITEQNTANERRFGAIEGIHAKIIGGLALGTFILPLITGLVIYVLTRSQ